MTADQQPQAYTESTGKHRHQVEQDGNNVLITFYNPDAELSYRIEQAESFYDTDLDPFLYRGDGALEVAVAADDADVDEIVAAGQYLAHGEDADTPTSIKHVEALLDDDVTPQRGVPETDREPVTIEEYPGRTVGDVGSPKR